MRRFTKQFGIALLIAGSGFTMAASQINYDVPDHSSAISVGDIAAKVIETQTNNSAVISSNKDLPLVEVKVKVLDESPKSSKEENGGAGFTPPGSINSTQEYTFGAFMRAGAVRWGGYKFTYYSQRVLPGTGLRIPGRHVNGDGYVCDSEGYIVLAGSAPKGTVYPTPFGAPGKIYDRGTSGNHLDVYVK